MLSFHYLPWYISAEQQLIVNDFDQILCSNHGWFDFLLKGKSYGEKVDVYNKRDVNISDW